MIRAAGGGQLARHALGDMPLGNAVQSQAHAGTREAQAVAVHLQMFRAHQLQGCMQLALGQPRASCRIAPLFQQAQQGQHSHVKRAAGQPAYAPGAFQQGRQLRRGVRQHAARVQRGHRGGRPETGKHVRQGSTTGKGALQGVFGPRGVSVNHADSHHSAHEKAGLLQRFRA